MIIHTLEDSFHRIHMGDNMAGIQPGVPHGVAGAPNEAALLKLMEDTGYTMIQENGQRKYGGPPPGWDAATPPRGCEVFVGKIPRDCYEDELVPIFENIGRIYELRLMMDFSGANRGYCFVMYTLRDDAKRAVKELNNFQIRKGRYLGVCLSVDNCRLFVGGIPKNKTKEEILTEMKKVTDGVVDVIVYPSATDKSKNRGFAFIEYESHRAAAMARRKLIPGRIQLWGHTIAVDWAEPEQEVDEDIMSKVKILYVRNLMLSTTEESLEQVFNQSVGKENAVERVKKLRDYAFVHFREREDALLALKILNDTNLEGTVIEVSLAKPVDKSDYVRYTRGIGSKTSLPQGVSQSAPSPFPYAGLEAAAPFLGMPGYYPASMATAVSAASPGIPLVGASKNVVRTTSVSRGSLRGRGRGAAGSRGAGGVQRSYIPPHMRGYRKLPIDEHLYDILPGMELTPTNPFTLKPQSVKNASQILDEFSQKNGLGTPIYQLHSTVGGAGGDVQLFLFKVSLPAITSTAFQPTKLCRTVEEAKNFAAEYVLMQLGVHVPMEVSQNPEVPSPVMATANVSTSPVSTPQVSVGAASLYQGRPIGPTAPYTLTNGAAATAAALHTDLGYTIASSQPYLVTPTAKLTTPTHPQSYQAFAPLGYQHY